MDRVAVQPDGRILVAGNFETYNGEAAPTLIRLQTDGNRDESFQYNDSPVIARALALGVDGFPLLMGSFNKPGFLFIDRLIRLNTNGALDRQIAIQPSSDDNLNTLLVKRDGSMIVGGDFNKFQNVARNGLARLLPDGALDVNFDPGRNFSSRSIDSLLEFADGDILVDSGAWKPRSDPMEGYLRIRPDGSLNPILPLIGSLVNPPFLLWDNTVVLGRVSSSPFLRTSEDGRTFPCFAQGVPLYPTILLPLSDGRILVTVRTGGSDASVYRLWADGSRDPTFLATFVGGNINHAVEDRDGNYWIAGSFETVNDQFSPGLVHLLAGDDQGPERIRFNGDQFGAFDDSQIVRVPLLRLGNTSNRTTIQFVTGGNGNALPGRDYVSTNGSVVFEPGQRTASLGVQVVPGGASDGDVSIPLQISGSSADVAGSSAYICLNSHLGVIEFATNHIFVREADHQRFVSIVRHGGPSSSAIVGYSALQGSASSADFGVTETRSEFQPGSSTTGFFITTADNSTVEHDRDFTVTLTNLPPDYRVGANRTVTITIVDDDLPGFPGEGLDTEAESLWPTPDGGVLLSGSFTNVHGNLRPGVAKLDANGLITPFMADAPFQPIRVLEVNSDGRILLELSTNSFHRGFTFGRETTTMLKLLDSGGAVLGTYHGTNRTLGAGLLPGGGIVRASARSQKPGSDGEYYYTFTRLEDSAQVVTNYLSNFRFSDDFFNKTTPAVSFSFQTNGSWLVSGNIAGPLNGFSSLQFLLRLDSKGNLDTTFDSGFKFSDSSFFDSAPIRTWSLATGRILVAGYFPTYQGDRSTGLLRLKNDGALDTAFQVGYPTYSQPLGTFSRAVAVSADGKILVPWRNGNEFRLLRLLTNGRLDSAFNTNAIADNTIDSVAIVADGRIVVSGNFMTFAGEHRARLAWLSADGELLPSRALEITQELPESDGQRRLELRSRKAAPGVVERSSDLKNWFVVASVTLVAGKTNVVVRDSASDVGYYRLRSGQ